MSRNCNPDDERLSGLVDGELPERERRRVAAHVLACPACSRQVGRLVATRGLMVGAQHAAEPPLDFSERLRERIDEVDGMRARVSFIPPPARRLVAIAAVGVILISGAAMLSSYLSSSVSTSALLVQAHARMGLQPWAGVAPAGAYSAVSVHPSPTSWRPVHRALLDLDGRLVTHTLYRVGRCPVSLFESPAGWQPLVPGEIVASAPIGLEVSRSGDACLVSWEANGLRCVLVARTTPEDLLELAGLRRSLTGRSPAL